jgi:hypothetical protein
MNHDMFAPTATQPFLAEPLPTAQVTATSCGIADTGIIVLHHWAMEAHGLFSPRPGWLH